MATLKELSISGVRNFSPDEDKSQTIRFTSPLTLILGQNGCGKTTIIEAIKYACTQKLPEGSSSNKAFVFNPKLCRRRVTQGRINLKIDDPRNGEVTVSRTIEFGKLSEKSNKSFIKIGENCSEGYEQVTQKCCEILDVSAPLLNNVIFCHQEDSFWPLKSAQVLKEKFDEIFEMEKYSKCIDELVKYHNGVKNEITNLHSQCNIAENKKNYVEERSLKLEEDKSRIISLEDSIEDQRKKLEIVEEEIKEIDKIQNAFSELSAKRREVQGIRRDQISLEENISFPFTGEDEELRNEIERIKQNMCRANLVPKLEKEESEIEKLCETNAKVLQETRRDLENLLFQRREFEKKLSQQKNLIKSVEKEITTNSDGACEETLLNRIKATLDIKQKQVKKLSDYNESDVALLEEELKKKKEEEICFKQTIESKKEQLELYQKKNSEVSNKLNNFSTCDEDLERCVTELQNIDENIKRLEDGFEESDENRKVALLTEEITVMKNNLKICEDIENERSSIKESEEEIKKIKEEQLENLKYLFGESIPEDNLKQLLLSKQLYASEMVKTMTEEVMKKQKEVTTLEVRRQNEKQKIETIENEIKDNLEKISRACSGGDFNETVENTRQKKQLLLSQREQHRSVKALYRQFIEKFETDSPCCPVCETDFSNRDSLVKKIITNLRNKVSEVPQELKKIEEELEKEEELYNTLQQLKIVKERTKQLAEELPQLKKCLMKIEENLEESVMELNSFETELDIHEKIVKICSDAILDVSSLDKYLVDVAKSQKNIAILEEGLVQYSGAGSDYFKSKIKEMTEVMTDYISKINDQKNQLQELTNHRKLLAEKQIRLEEYVKSKRTLETEMTDYTSKITQCRKEISELEESLFFLETELKNVRERKENIKTQNNDTIESEKNRVKNFEKTVEGIQKLQSEIDDYLNSNVNEAIRLSEMEVKKYEEEENMLKCSKNKINRELTATKSDLARLPVLQNHIMLREKKSLERKLECEIRSLEEQVGTYDEVTAASKKQELTGGRDNLNEKIHELMGQKTELVQSVESLQNELAQPENLDTINTYRRIFYKLKIAESMSNDLPKYINALDNAVLEFHRQKLTQVNLTIREMWRQIYRGNDIDYIEIKPEFITSNDKRRTYSYKVVQVKNGIEVNMKFCCSAGQKFLACLIIRMALAERLSSNCGILALDEPTTNLDRENIQSLCDTLCHIIKVREKEKNFQLVIITHDEEFLSALRRVHGASVYYRVRRDKNGHSIIEPESL